MEIPFNQGIFVSRIVDMGFGAFDDLAEERTSLLVLFYLQCDTFGHKSRTCLDSLS